VLVHPTLTMIVRSLALLPLLVRASDYRTLCTVWYQHDHIYLSQFHSIWDTFRVPPVTTSLNRMIPQICLSYTDRGSRGATKHTNRKIDGTTVQERIRDKYAANLASYREFASPASSHHAICGRRSTAAVRRRPFPCPQVNEALCSPFVRGRASAS
jgi:hypothetical protein